MIAVLDSLSSPSSPFPWAHKSSVAWLNQWRGLQTTGAVKISAQTLFSAIQVSMISALAEEVLFRGAVPFGASRTGALASVVAYSWFLGGDRARFAAMSGLAFSLAGIFGGLAAAIATHALFMMLTALLFLHGVARSRVVAGDKGTRDLSQTTAAKGSSKKRK